MTIICIDTGTKESGYCIVKDGVVMDGAILENESLYALIMQYDDLHKEDGWDGIDLAIIEMITLFGGRRKSAHITESILVIGRIMQIMADRGIDCKRVSRQQIVAHFLKGQSSRADTKIQALMRERLGLGKSRHPFLKRHIWQSLALYEYAKDHSFSKWYVPNLEIVKKEKQDPAKSKERRRKFLQNEINKNTRALAQLDT